MKVQNWPISAVKPYPNNPRRNGSAVDAVARSIKEFGFQQPIVVDEKGVIIVGHTRLQAAKKLKMTMVPVTVAHLTEDEAKAYRLADNKTNELAEWDEDLLQGELDDLFDYGMDDFGFDLETPEEKHDKNVEKFHRELFGILNVDKGRFQGDGTYDIPQLKPVMETPPIEEWLSFNFMLTDPEPEKHGLHFFIDDFQFERIWNNPEKYVNKLRRYAAVATPDFSPYSDMPLACQIFNHYRKHWVGAFLQQRGVRVIPTIRASLDPRSYDYYLEGEPHGGIVVISAMWTKSEEGKEAFKKEFYTMKETLDPCKIYVYGKMPFEDNKCVEIPRFTDKIKARKGLKKA